MSTTKNMGSGGGKLDVSAMVGKIIASENYKEFH